MADTISTVIGELSAMTGWEAVAVVLAIAYLLFAMRASLWCWPAAFFSTLIYTILFWHVSLLMESALNVFYMVMALYGYWQWRWGGGPQQQGVAVHRWPWRRHGLVIGLTAVTAVTAGYLMANYTHAALPYLDAATTCFAIVATFMLAFKVLENWLYWVVIDIASIYLYIEKGFVLTSVLFVGYVVLAAVSYWLWRSRLLKPVDETSLYAEQGA
ncbi:nicotinamide riboside transporter PnuC [Neiella marina]|uniref:Nicotinamide riboside transporter PnuC n=1 Tax=Neiella holothuriorum TaxID=2870530 RepID=A0ABS7EJY6_9GAMM|nr:nicotinamide riboside transporter PnuC [Neiella holothuriorum]MBW8192539.1 nicotinamide riboside transporter PnuC [Neiella holothuriorum]